MKTPYYLIDEAALQRNLQIMAHLRDRSGAKVLLALKCFSTWSVFPLMSRMMDGTTSSSLNEVRLGHEKFGGETHAYSVAFADHEIEEVISHSDKIIFNSISQLDRFADASAATTRGLRVNPGLSTSDYPLADPARPFSRLGEHDPGRVEAALDRYAAAQGTPISGFMFHNNCDNADFERFCSMLDEIEHRFAHLLERMEWVSLGGGILFTTPGYPLEAFADRLRAFAERFRVQVYLEPGEAAITRTTTLETTVLDLLENEKQIAVVDSSIEAHMLDLLIYRLSAKRDEDAGDHSYLVCGKSCLAGDIFGEFRFAEPLKIGDRISFADAAGYTMVKKNWFNGVAMPAIVVKRLDNRLEIARAFDYSDFLTQLS